MLNHIDYSSFGKVLQETQPAAGDRFKFTGRELDLESGLYYYRARYYDADQGRFISHDPLGFLGGDSNLYRYVGNAPVNASDPFGLVAVSERAAIHSKEPQEAPAKSFTACMASEAFFTVAFAAAGLPPNLLDLSGSVIQCALAPGAPSARTASSTPNTLATNADEAVFWSGVGRGGDKRAAAWVAENGGATLETTLASRNIKLPRWDPKNPLVVAAWRQASKDFAGGSKGNVRVLQGETLRIDAIFRDEFKALIANPNVKSITSINPKTGQIVLLWSR